MNLPDDIKAKLVTLEEAQNLFNADSRATETIVFTNGCFDILHQGHIHLLASAKALGSKLIVGLNSDSSVRILKGPSRPVKNEETRALILASLTFVDFIIIFPEETPARLIEAISPDVLAKGGDYKPEEIVGADYVESHGGKVSVIPFLEGHSTTSLINKSK